jgi:hypothetical protein
MAITTITPVIGDGKRICIRTRRFDPDQAAAAVRRLLEAVNAGRYSDAIEPRRELEGMGLHLLVQAPRPGGAR